MFRFRAVHRFVSAPTRRVLATSPTNAGKLLSVKSPLLQQPPAVAIRSFGTLSDEKEINKRLGDFQDLFVEARLCIEDAQESVGSTYFEEDSEAAMEAVQEAVDAFDKLIEDVEDEAEKNRILRGNGLKVEQLKGELEMAMQGGHDHH